MKLKGKLLFHKEFVHHDRLTADRAQTLCNLVSTYNFRWTAFIGTPCVFIEFDQMSLAMVTNRKYKIVCLLVYSSDHGEEFGKLIATELVEAFALAYGDRLLSESDASVPIKFKGFELKIGSAVKNALSPILEYLQSQKGINMAILYSSDQILPHNLRVDPISFVSEYRSLIFQTKQIMTFARDSDAEVCIESKDQVIIIKNIQNAALVVTINQDVQRKVMMSLINKYALVIKSVLKLVQSLGNIHNDTFQLGAVL